MGPRKVYPRTRKVKPTLAKNFTARVKGDDREIPLAVIDPEPSVRRPAVFLYVILAATLLGCGESATSKIEVTLRNAPSRESDIVTRIPQGSTVRLSKCSHGWCEVSWNAKQGYAFAKNFVVGGTQIGADADDDKQDLNSADD
jgi:hypothetical protein